MKSCKVYSKTVAVIVIPEFEFSSTSFFVLMKTLELPETKITDEWNETFKWRLNRFI